MLDFLNKLRLLRLNPKMSEDLIEVIDILSTLRDSSSEISVQVEGVPQSFSSIVRGISPKHRLMVIDSAPPEIEIPNLQRNKPLTLSTSLSGRDISFRSKFLEPFMPDINMGYQIEMPAFLGTEQPRGAFRIMLDEMRERVSITLRDTQNHQIEGVVKNISRSGVGMKTSDEFSTALKESSGSLDCLIDLQESDQIACKMEIRNVQQRGNGAPETYVGGRMVDISRQDSGRLLDFIEHMQTMRLKAMIA